MNTNLPSRRGSGGFTLVELMVAILLGLFLIGALISLVVSTIGARNELDKTTRQIDNGRYALQVMEENIQLAGYVGMIGTSTYKMVPPVACPAGLADLGYAESASPPTMPYPVYVYVPTATPACLLDPGDNAYHVVPNTAMVIVTRADTTPVAAPGAAGEQYLQSSTCADDLQSFVAANGGSASASIFNLKQKDCSTAKLAPLRKLVQQLYYVSSCNECGTDTTPTLKVAEWINGVTKISSLVEGIENLQVEFGIDMDQNGSPDCYVSNPTNVADPKDPAAAEIALAVCPQPAAPAPAYVWTQVDDNWSNVMTVRVYALARNVDSTPGWSDTKQYKLGGNALTLGLANRTVGPAKDGYKRHAYSSTVRLYNASGQREIQ